MLKTAALALVVLVTGVVGSNSALAGGTGTGIRHFPARIGKIAQGNGSTMKQFPRKLDKKISVAGSSKVLAPRRLPGL
ncbi:MAG: hypothetical protein L0241_22735 [Planctomycetia bacterium]|nr:hypothetical protein [Planctomycetia bacterium]